MLPPRNTAGQFTSPSVAGGPLFKAGQLRDTGGRYTRGRGAVEVDQESFQRTIDALGRYKQQAKAVRAEAVRAAGDILLARVRANASRTDYSLDDLAEMDHPYARRHGTIQTGPLGGAYAQRPYMVQKRSGTLLSAIVGKPSASGQGYEVQARPVAPHVQYVIQGTRVMLPRDVVQGTANEAVTQRLMMEAMSAVLRRKL